MTDKICCRWHPTAPLRAELLNNGTLILSCCIPECSTEAWRGLTSKARFDARPTQQIGEPMEQFGERLRRWEEANK